MSLILDGTNGLSDVDGTAGTPAIRGSDANTGIFFGADIIGFSEGGTECARFNADAQFVAAAGTASLPVITTTGDVNTGIFFPAADTIAFAEGGAESMRIDSSGNLLVGTTTSGAGAARAYVVGDATNPALRVLSNTATTSVYAGVFRHESTTAGAYIQFVTDGNAETGRIFDSGGTMQYASSSDARLKTNVQQMQNGLDSVLALNPCTFDMHRGENTIIASAGLIAQEVNEVYPYVVGVGGEDANTNPWSVDYGKLTPLLVSAIQELKAINDAQAQTIESLTARVVALEQA